MAESFSQDNYCGHLEKDAVQMEEATRRENCVLLPEDASQGSEREPCKESRRDRCRKSCLKFLSPILAEGHKPLNSAPMLHKLKYSILCPPHGVVGKLLTVTALIGVSWTSGWCIVGASFAPGGNIFALLTLLTLCYIAGQVVRLVKLPPLLGMLLMGGILRNVPYINVARDIDKQWLISLRLAALVVILLRAGLGLDPKALRKLSLVVVRLAFTPCLVEAAVIAVAAHLILGFPWAWGILLGLVIGAVTPAVVVPCILGLSERGYGVDRGIPTLVIAASSIDDVLAITGFSLTLGYVFDSGGHLADTITKGPRGVILGVVCGSLYGVTLWYIPTRKATNKSWLRLGLLLAGGLAFVFGSEMADLPSAGPIGCLTLAFVSAYRWRRENIKQYLQVDSLMESVWTVAEPFMFGLIGAEIDLTTLNAKTAGLGLSVLLIGLVFRIITSFLVVFGTDLSLKEKLFVAIAWLPKATVQAAIGPVAFDKAVRSNGSPQEQAMGLQILNIAVMSIILTAPLGGALISLTGPKLLSKSPLQEETTTDVQDDR